LYCIVLDRGAEAQLVYLIMFLMQC